MKKVLLIDDDVEYLEMWKMELGRLGVEYVEATTIETAKALFDDFGSIIDLIVMDACVPGRIPTTLKLTREIREMGFTGPIIATSSSNEYRIQQMEAGCDYGVTEKDHVVPKIIELLGLNSQ